MFVLKVTKIIRKHVLERSSDLTSAWDEGKEEEAEGKAGKKKEEDREEGKEERKS